MTRLTDGQIDAIQFPSIDYATAHVIRTHRRTFARAVIAEHQGQQDAEIERLRAANGWSTNMARAPHGVEVLVTLSPVRKGAKSKVAIATRWTENGRGHAGPAEWSAHDDQINTPIAWMKLPTPYVEALASKTEEK